MSERNQDVTEVNAPSPARSKGSTAPGSRTRRSAGEKAAPGAGSAKLPAKRPTLKKPASPATVKPKTSRTKKVRAMDQKVVGKRTRRSLPSAKAVSSITLDHEEVARLAYFYWESRGRQGGTPEQDWYRAEEELHKRSAQ